MYRHNVIRVGAHLAAAAAAREGRKPGKEKKRERRLSPCTIEFDKKNKINVKKKEPEREASNSGQAKTLLVRLKTPRPLSLSRLLSAL